MTLRELTDKELAGKELKPRFSFSEPSFGTQTTTPQISLGGKTTEETLGDIAKAPFRLAGGALKFARGVQTGVAQSGGSVGLSALGIKEFKLGFDASVLERLTYKAIFGEEPLESIGTRVEKFPERAKDFGISEKFATKIAPISILGITIADFLPGGKSAKGVVSQLVKLRNVDEVKNVLRGLKIPVEVIDDVAESVAKSTNPTEIDDLLRDSLEKFIETEKIAPKISTDLQPLAQEARKYKSAEEFVKDWSFTQDYYKPNFALPGGNLKKVLQNRRSFNLGDILSEQAPKQFQDIRSIPVNFVGDGIKIVGSSKAFGTETLGMVTIENGRPVIYLSDRLAGSPKFNDVLGHEIEHALTAAKNPAFFSSVKSEISATANATKRSELAKSQLTDFYNQAVKEQDVKILRYTK